MMQRSPELEFKLKHLSDSPGCYLMKSGGEIIYVGKAKNLKHRVKQYFQSTRNHTPKVLAMVEKVDDFDTVLTRTEFEALILECNLIKLHRPYYNILLKDDKHYPYLAIDLDEPYARLQIRRTLVKDGCRYFGPYHGATVLREVLDAVRSVFPVRVCEKVLNPEKHERPCVHHATGQCLAPCAGKISVAEYRALLDGVMEFLSGHYDGILHDLKDKMAEAAEARSYERAAVYRDRIRAIERIMEKQRAIATDGSDQDALCVRTEGVDALVERLSVRDGKLIGFQTHTLPRAGDEPPGDVLVSFILQHYDAASGVPREILLSHAVPEPEPLEQLLSEARGGKVKLHVPSRGEKKRMIELCEKNLAEQIAKRAERLNRSFKRTTGALNELSDVLGLKAPPRRIEGYDISNTLGQQSVGSMVVMIDGVAANRAYRHFKIKTVVGADDFASHREVMTRRLKRGLEERAERIEKGLDPRTGSFSDLPDLILIDGGVGQLNAALGAMHAQGLDIPMFGLAERLDEIVLPNQRETIYLDRRSEALHLIQRLRDEAHRFGITHHRKLRAKQSIHSALDDIPGIGPKKKKALLKQFKTIESLKRATEAELSEAGGIGPALAHIIREHFDEAKGDPT